MTSQADGTVAAVISLVLALAASAFWLLVPVGSLLTGLSIGLYYLPSALAMSLAAALDARLGG